MSDVVWFVLLASAFIGPLRPDARTAPIAATAARDAPFALDVPVPPAIQPGRVGADSPSGPDPRYDPSLSWALLRAVAPALCDGRVVAGDVDTGRYDGPRRRVSSHFATGPPTHLLYRSLIP